MSMFLLLLLVPSVAKSHAPVFGSYMSIDKSTYGLKFGLVFISVRVGLSGM